MNLINCEHTVDSHSVEYGCYDSGCIDRLKHLIVAVSTGLTR